MDKQLQRMKAAYIECALWASTDEDGESLEYIGTITDDACAALENDCEEFIEHITELGIAYESLDYEQMGHDLFLTRNRHGAGFWGRGLGELGDKLTKAAHAMGERALWIDGARDIHAQP